MDALLSAAVLLATLSLVLLRPLGANEAWWAVLGGVLTLALGLVTPRQAFLSVWETREALMVLVGMMALGAVAEGAGFFEWAASLAARLGGGGVRRLYASVFLVGSLVTATLSLDATAVVLTPIVYAMAVRLRLAPLPFVFACVYAANTASLFLPVSNLTNLLAYDALDLGFARFALVMLLPAALAVATNLVLFLWMFRSDLGGSYGKAAPFVPENRPFFRLAAWGVGGVVAAFFGASAVGAPVGPVALAAGAALVAAARAKGWMALGEAARSVSWGVVALVVGLFVVVQGVENAGLTALARGAMAAAAPGDGLAQILGITFVAAVASNLVNNLPATVVFLNAAGPLVSDGSLQPAAAYAALIGTNVGPNLTIVGSLATLIWLGVARGRGVEVTAKDYLKVGIVATPAILLSAAFGLWVSWGLFGGG